MQLEIAHYYLTFRHPFRIASNTRNGTDCIYVKLSTDKYAGYGEITLPPYLEETPESVLTFLRKIRLDEFSTEHDFNLIRNYIHQSGEGSSFAKCGLEEALTDLFEKAGKQVLDTSFQKNDPPCTFTLGMSENETEIEEKLFYASAFPWIKVKLGIGDDRKTIRTIRKHTDKPLCADANQGWSNPEDAVSLSAWMKTQNVQLIEQPFPKERTDLQEAFFKRSHLPVIADEAVQNDQGLEKILGIYHGINIKLLKCGGPVTALKMAETAKKHNKLILLGCMSESACGVHHAGKLSSLADVVDLDGPYLITNNPFEGFSINDGKIRLSALHPVNNLSFSPL